MIHSNPVRLIGGLLRVDRKFHVGMLRYCDEIRAPLVTVHPEAAAGQQAMDTIELDCSALPYGVMVMNNDLPPAARTEQAKRLEAQIARSALVYGTGMGCEAIAHAHGVPYIMILEYDLLTQTVVSRTQVQSPLRKLSRTLRVALNHYRHTIPQVRAAAGVHCNGYPIHDALRGVSDARLLYLDSRMPAEMVIAQEALTTRLAGRAGRPVKLLYSGRYEPLKGAVDAVKAGIDAVARGLDVEMHCYGTGSQAGEMRRLVDAASMTARIHIHDAVTFPELVALSRGFDVFVCCHIQNDPSCTYLESFGAGLPIVGYGNGMWRRLCEESGAGLWSPIGRPARVADDIQRLIGDPPLMDAMSNQARSFALTHCFENEFALRTDALNRALDKTKA